MDIPLMIQRLEKLLEEALVSINKAKHTALSYSGDDPTDEDIATWKADATLKDIERLRREIEALKSMQQSAPKTDKSVH